MEQLKQEYNSKLAEFNKAWRWTEQLKDNKKAVSELKLQEIELKLRLKAIEMEIILNQLKQKGVEPIADEIKNGFKIGVIEGQVELKV